MENNMNYDGMDYPEFRGALQDQLVFAPALEQFNPTVGFARIPKANGSVDTLYVKLDKESPVAPVVYPSVLYEEYQAGKPFDQIVQDAAELVARGFNHGTELPELTAENAREAIRLSVVNADRSSELLSRCPHEQFGDLAAIPRWHINEEQTFVVTNELAGELRLTKEEIMDIARKNTKAQEFSIRNMNEVLVSAMRQMGGGEDYISEMMIAQKSPLYVITTKDGYDGSAALMSDRTLQQIADALGENYAIIPSSRHEILAIPDAEGLPTEEMHQMVYTINRNEVAPGDYLSDSVYHYDAQTHKLERISEPGVPLYRHDRDHALENGEIELYRDSLKANVACKDAIEASIRDGFDGMHLDKTAAKQVLTEYGPSRTQYVLAATVHDKSYDGRFSTSNRAWGESVATEFPGSERYVVNSHPTVVNGYIDQVRSEDLNEHVEQTRKVAM